MATLSETLLELEQVLDTEERALRKMDAIAVEAAIPAKIELETRLRGLLSQSRAPAGVEKVIRRVRGKAQRNQLLTAHARSCIRGLLELVGINVAPAYSVGRPAPANLPAVRVDTRG